LPSLPLHLAASPPQAPPAAPPASKLPPINAGKAAYSLPEEEEQSPVEKVVFRLAWAGIGTLVAIEAEGRARPRGGERHTQSLFTAH